MPVEIKNLFISANIYDGKKKDGANEKQVTQVQAGPVMDEDTKLHIIDQAVQQVLELLERLKDR